ncbi:alpha/beta fold hydrolase [Streptomyces alkaliterrae]|uniref:Alpha/beta fold hydrolase n=1 Tax=Streptomyces alkaliterrae TaxID=2213162 RepID=A0A5P0YPT2_9ACTN|nr:alpha/beta fold hydrolase [Streptomyces alkaliterrae]MBB1255138.1 alpha/beta fold hydrolase [Streptomyces alkaliterrae]MBB1261362.1 alpha/beta fold hydrolase [Streptomyces alkaliterrae]MQS02363.1 alpha/beta fold hydrolase [Streptomyces alkaliterrae]
MSKPPTLELPPGARAHRLATDRGEFAVHDAGEPARGTALLVPGFTGSKEDFITLLAPLARAGLRVVAVDGRGQHESTGPTDDEAAYAQSELAADVLALARALGGPVHLLGHSMGGLVSRAAVLLDASPFRSLTVMSSGPGAVAPAQQQRLKMLLGALPVMDMAAVWDAMIELDPPEAADVSTPPEVSAFLRERWMNTSPAQLSATAQQLIAEPDRVEELAAVDLPKHVLHGALDYAWPVEDIAEMADRLGARHTIVEDAAHSPAVENPTATARALLDFWAADQGR